VTSPDHEYRAELTAAIDAAHEAGRILLRHYAAPSKSWEKSEDNPVTHADLEADAAIGARLRAAFPGDGILSEETANDPTRTTRPRAWIVDPMDGTKEFVGRIPEFAVSIALAERGEPVVGVILNPAAGVGVFATRGGGAWRARWSEDGLGEAEPARVSRVKTLREAVVIASRTEISRKKFEPYAGWFRELRPVGSIAWKLACVACGDGDLNVSVAPKNEWDVCAGDAIVREAGGVYLAFDGTRRVYNRADPHVDASMAAGPPDLVAEFCARERARAAG
jgi:myo-inositol-1(or 4)-monophosphatase